MDIVTNVVDMEQVPPTYRQTQGYDWDAIYAQLRDLPEGKALRLSCGIAARAKYAKGMLRGRGVQDGVRVVWSSVQPNGDIYFWIHREDEPRSSAVAPRQGAGQRSGQRAGHAPVLRKRG